jgi:hypothetical protein
MEATATEIIVEELDALSIARIAREIKKLRTEIKATNDALSIARIARQIKLKRAELTGTRVGKEPEAPAPAPAPAVADEEAPPVPDLAVGNPIFAALQRGDYDSLEVEPFIQKVIEAHGEIGEVDPLKDPAIRWVKKRHDAAMKGGATVSEGLDLEELERRLEQVFETLDRDQRAQQETLLEEETDFDINRRILLEEVAESEEESEEEEDDDDDSVEESKDETETEEEEEDEDEDSVEESKDETETEEEEEDEDEDSVEESKHEDEEEDEDEEDDSVEENTLDLANRILLDPINPFTSDRRILLEGIEDATLEELLLEEQEGMESKKKSHSKDKTGVNDEELDEYEDNEDEDEIDEGLSVVESNDSEDEEDEDESEDSDDEDDNVEEAFNAFIAAAAQAKSQGKGTFKFNGKSYPQRLKANVSGSGKVVSKGGGGVKEKAKAVANKIKSKAKETVTRVKQAILREDYETLSNMVDDGYISEELVDGICMSVHGQKLDTLLEMAMNHIKVRRAARDAAKKGKREFTVLGSGGSGQYKVEDWLRVDEMKKIYGDKYFSVFPEQASAGKRASLQIQSGLNRLKQAVMGEAVNDLLDILEDEGHLSEEISEEYRPIEESRTYKVVHTKKGTMNVEAKSSYEACKIFAKEKRLKSTAGVSAYLMESVSEGYRRRGGFSSEPREMMVKYATTCAETKKPLKKGERALYYPNEKKFFSLDSKTARDWSEAKFDEDWLGASY